MEDPAKRNTPPSTSRETRVPREFVKRFFAVEELFWPFAFKAVTMLPQDKRIY